MMHRTRQTVLERARARQDAQDDLDLAQHRLIVAKALADPAKALRNLKARLRTRARDLLDPKWQDDRKFPQWYPGMTTADYIACCRGSGPLKPISYTHRTGVPAPWNEPGVD